MARKKKENQKIYVKNPKIGKKYWFKFIGTWDYGTIITINEKLEEHYGEPWYTLEDKKGMKYPISIFNIRNEKPLIRENV